MEIYPIHLRKKRSVLTDKSVVEIESEKLKKNIRVLLDDFDKLKQHIEYMDKKYK